MKSIIFSLVLVSSLIVIVQGTHWRIKLLEPRGFWIELKNAGQCWSVMASGRISRRRSHELVSFNGDFLRVTSSRWMYQSLTTAVNGGDSIIFELTCVPEGEYDNSRGVSSGVVYTVPYNAVRVPT